MELKGYFIRESGLLFIKGKERRDFFHRISTNDFSKSSESNFVPTVLTTDKGRIIDLVCYFEFKDYALLQTTKENEDIVIDFLKKYIVSDDVEISKSFKNYVKIIIYGAEGIKAFLSNYIFEKELPVPGFIDDEEAVIYHDPQFDSRLIILAPENKLEHYTSLLSDKTLIDRESYDIFSMENLIMENKNELNEDINPIECGLKRFISYNKGCYIGQEVIARLDSQNKIPKTMTRFDSKYEILQNDRVYVKVNESDTECGFVSTSLKSKSGFCGYAFIRSNFLESQNNYFVKRENENISLITSLLKIK